MFNRENYITVAVLMGVGVLVVLLAPIALERNAEVRCRALQRQSEEYELFYLTPSEKRMCDEVGVKIDAPLSISHETTSLDYSVGLHN